MRQDSVYINKIEVPIIKIDGEEWFPVSYLTTKVLLRSGKSGLMNKSNKEKFNQHLNKYSIQFGNTNVQESNCISKTGLIELLIHTRIGRLSNEQRLAQNELHKYLGIELLPVGEQDSNEYKNGWYDENDAYTNEIIKNELTIDNPDWIRMCSKCNGHFPLTSRFFSIDSRADKGFTKICKVCSGKYELFAHQNVDILLLKKQDLFEFNREESLFEIYDAYRNKKLTRLPNYYENKESYEMIIKELYKRGELTEYNLTYDYISKKCRLSGISRYMDIVDIYKLLFGEDFYLYTWKYPKFIFKSLKLTTEIANQIIKNYIKEHKITITDKFKYNYDQLFRNCKITNITNGDILGFVVQLYEYKYAGYLFKISSHSYYRNEKNLLFDLKYLIENDMKLDISKIPLYLTRNMLHKKSNSLYGYIVTKGNGSLYEWIDKLYPNQFIEADFEINAHRNEFDSDKEMYIHEVLCENFKNVIYNQKHTNRTIILDGMIPDWLVITEHGVYIVEYFGLYEERQYGISSRVTDYIDKTKKKIERYKEMEGYKFMFIYPKDIEDDEIGIREIIAKMKEKPYVPTV